MADKPQAINLLQVAKCKCKEEADGEEGGQSIKYPDTGVQMIPDGDYVPNHESISASLEEIILRLLEVRSYISTAQSLWVLAYCF